jgi:5,10-methylenetetrahydrofolate reductase
LEASTPNKPESKSRVRGVSPTPLKISVLAWVQIIREHRCEIEIAHRGGRLYCVRQLRQRKTARQISLARQHDLAVSLITQFGFDPEPVHRWIAALRARGIDCPVEVGVAGPASVATLAKFAFRCGVGASLCALARGHTAFARILAEATPDAFIASLVAGEDAGAPIDGLHLFTFGGVRRAAEWMRTRAAGTS